MKSKHKTLVIAPVREDSHYRFVQWNNHQFNLQEAKKFLDKAYKAENELHTYLDKIANILQKYTNIEIHGDWVTSDKAVISWDDNEYNHNVIPVESFLEAIKLVRPGRDKLTEDDLSRLSI